MGLHPQQTNDIKQTKKLKKGHCMIEIWLMNLRGYCLNTTIVISTLNRCFYLIRVIFITEWSIWIMLQTQKFNHFLKGGRETYGTSIFWSLPLDPTTEGRAN